MLYLLSFIAFKKKLCSYLHNIRKKEKATFFWTNFRRMLWYASMDEVWFVQLICFHVLNKPWS